MAEGAKPIDPGVDIGHVHLKVAEIERSLDFYCGVLGFELQQRFGEEAAFVSAGGYHHHIGLNTWQSKGGSPPPPGTTGLFHFAIRYPTRARPRRRPAPPDPRQRSASPAPPTTASARRSTSTTPTATGSSSTGTGRRSEWPATAAGPEGRDVHAATRPRGPARRARAVGRRQQEPGWTVARPRRQRPSGRGREPPRRGAPQATKRGLRTWSLFAPLVVSLGRTTVLQVATSLPNSE